MLGEMILTAWERISGELVVTGFKNCCTYKALHNTEDELLWQDKKDSDCEEDSGDEYEDEEQSENENSE
jgi:hypothetical protein